MGTRGTGPRLRMLVAGLAAALVAAGCGGQSTAAITDEESALRAVAESFAGSWAWAGQVEVELTDAQFEQMLDLTMQQAPADERELIAEQARRQMDEFDRQRMHGALADDQSFRTAWERDGSDLVDLRLDFGEVLTAESMTPSAALLGAADVAGILQMTYDVEGGDPADAVTVDQVRDQARQAITDSKLLEVVMAIFDGGFGGLVGELDLAAAGVGEAQLDELRAGFAQDLIGLADADTFVELAGEAMTLRDIRAEGGSTSVLVDVHPRDAAFAVYDLFDDAEALAEQVAGDPLDAEELPETLSEVARLTFDADGDLTEVRTDVLAVARELADHVDLGADNAEETLEILRDATVDVVFSFSDHDAVDTVTDVEATTIRWESILDYFQPAIDDALE